MKYLAIVAVLCLTMLTGCASEYYYDNSYPDNTAYYDDYGYPAAWSLGVGYPYYGWGWGGGYGGGWYGHYHGGYRGGWGGYHGGGYHGGWGGGHRR